MNKAEESRRKLSSYPEVPASDDGLRSLLRQQHSCSLFEKEAESQRLAVTILSLCVVHGTPMLYAGYS